MKTSWKTSLAGCAAALGVAAQAITEPAWLRIAGLAIATIGLACVGAFARDNDKTSEAVGAKPEETKP